MINKVEVVNDLGELLTLELSDVSDGIVLKEIDGLGPTKATLVSSSFTNSDGEQYQSAKREARDIKLTLGMESMYGGESVSAIRQRLYRFFMTKREVILRFFMDDGLNVEIRGRVESNDPPMFTREPEMVIQVRCFDPDFLEQAPAVINGNTTSDDTAIAVNYDGTVETGFQFKMLINRSISEFTIYLQSTDGTTRSLPFAAPLLSGDILILSTQSGNKFARVIRNGEETSLLYGISPYANWLELYSGINNLRVYAEGSAIPYQIIYTKRHGGL